MDPSQLIAGRPGVEVRDFLREVLARVRHPVPLARSDLESAAAVVLGRRAAGGERKRRAVRRSVAGGQSARYVSEVVPGLVSAHLITELSGGQQFILTSAGVRVAAATCARRLRRSTAEALLAVVVARAQDINRNAGLHAYVVRLELFGSLLDPSVGRPADIDLAYEVADRCDVEGRRSWQIPGCYVEDSSTPVLRALKQRSRAVSLHSSSSVGRLTPPPARRVLFEAAPTEVAPFDGAAYRSRGC